MLAGAIGSIMIYPGPYFEAISSYPLPASIVNSDQASIIADYLESTENAIAVIMKSEDINNVSTPYVASFSSRGPNPTNKNILKPDLTARGVRILAACGIAAYIKTFNPKWSPAAIKSALMTTASVMNGETDAEFAYGAGYLNPLAAMKPGLIYDAFEIDYTLKHKDNVAELAKD
ncbi:unnamed protein product [Lactuca virosa]|uniref:Peptidase S8/S53 domain-containing protein n=1 Tax=Lactuca virosa TaxID=75947 RepID=A0AAU9LQM0_9ASTR|nr:unnamed protein product [Lactuca virosa]